MIKNLLSKSKISCFLLLMAVGLLMASLFISIYQNGLNRNSVKWIMHTYQVINESSQLFNEIKTVEMVCRNALINPDPLKHKKQFNSGLNDIDRRLKLLRLLTIDNPVQTKLLDEKIIPFYRTQAILWENDFSQKRNKDFHFEFFELHVERDARLEKILHRYIYLSGMKKTF